MTKHAPAWAALILCALCALLIAGLTALHDDVPNVLELLAIGSLTGATGLAMPALSSRETVRVPASIPASAAAPASIPAPAAPAGVSR